MPKDLFFASSNPYKIQELVEIAKPRGYDVKQVNLPKIHEIQTDDLRALVLDKTLQAFKLARLPIVVDHGGLHIRCLKGMPAGLTQLFWDRLEGKICDIVRALGDNAAQATSFIGYCNGKQLFTYDAAVDGTISDAPRGARAFQWDVIFVPDRYAQTYAEMSIPDKNKISQRRVAFEKLLSDIDGGKV